MLKSNPHIYLISDSTGETVSIVARSVYARFENIEFQESRWALIRTNKQIDNIIFLIKKNPGLILYTMINKKLEKYLQKRCSEINITAHPILDNTIKALKQLEGLTITMTPFHIYMGNIYKVIPTNNDLYL